ncbi:MAG TPA: heat-inducible transcriptional repressor HrcA [Acidimicrobiales bacterium]|nr:heat-inducible transcriptional repressor HrcA [Acidimicrobiales bacterium]
MLDERKAAILRAVVEEYVRTAQPVGSGHVATSAALAVSPATVRNEMGQLEREGYLVQPHTSAGRIPTDKGYRFFVDSLPPGTLDRTQAQTVRAFFDRAHGELERMLGDTSRLLSELTHYAAVVTSPSHHDPARLRSVQLVGLSSRVALVVAVYSDGAVEKHSLEFDEPVTDTEIAAATAHLTSCLTGSTAGERRPLPATGDAGVDRVARRAQHALTGGSSDAGEGHLFVGGAASMAQAFDAVDTIRQVLGILEQQVVLVALLRDTLNAGLSVAIGAEHGVQPLADCSVVVAPYEVAGERVGTVGLLGPTRMRYDQALSAVKVVSRRLGRALTEGG